MSKLDIKWSGIVLVLIMSLASGLAWITPDSVSSQSSEHRTYIVENSIDDNTSSYWAEDEREDVDGSTYEWYVTYDMGKAYKIESIRVYGDGNVNTAPCKIGVVKVCDDSGCSGESNLLIAICGFNSSLGWHDCTFTATYGRYLQLRGGVYDSLNFPPCMNKDTGGEMVGFVEIDAYGNGVPVIEDIADAPDPVDYGNDIEFMVNWTDSEVKEQVKIFICKTGSINDGESPSCPGGNWCSSDDYDGVTPINCTYTTTPDDIGQKGYYPFACDDEGACSEEWAMSPFFTVEDGTTPYYSNQADDAGTGVESGAIVNVSTYWADAVDLDIIRFRTNSSGVWSDNATCALSGETNETWCNKTINTTNLGGKTVCWVQVANDTAGNTNETMGENDECFGVKQSCAIAIDLSPTLSSIDWSVTTLPANDLDAEGNGVTVETEYWVNVSATGCTADLYIKANGSLVSGSDSIGLANETYCYNTTYSSVPGTACTSLDTTYSGNQIGSALAGNTAVYLKFYLDVPSQQPAGTYSNTISIKAVQNGNSP